MTSEVKHRMTVTHLLQHGGSGEDRFFFLGFLHHPPPRRSAGVEILGFLQFAQYGKVFLPSHIRLL